MVHLVRPLCLLLAALMALAGGAIDLCGCDGDVHGALCPVASAPAPAAEPCCAPHGCCAAEEPETPEGPTIGAFGCDCPIVLLDVSPAEADAPSKATAGDLSQAFVAALVGTASTDERGAVLSARPPPPGPEGIRRHLLLGVLRC